MQKKSKLVTIDALRERERERERELHFSKQKWVFVCWNFKIWKKIVVLCQFDVDQYCYLFLVI
jgi:hypothetical protein